MVYKQWFESLDFMFYSFKGVKGFEHWDNGQHNKNKSILRERGVNQQILRGRII